MFCSNSGGVLVTLRRRRHQGSSARWSTGLISSCWCSQCSHRLQFVPVKFSSILSVRVSSTHQSQEQTLQLPGSDPCISLLNFCLRSVQSQAVNWADFCPSLCLHSCQLFWTPQLLPYKDWRAANCRTQHSVSSFAVVRVWSLLLAGSLQNMYGYF